MVTVSRGSDGAAYLTSAISIIAMLGSGSSVLAELRTHPEAVISASGGDVLAKTGATYDELDFKTTAVALMRFE